MPGRRWPTARGRLGYPEGQKHTDGHWCVRKQFSEPYIQAREEGKTASMWFSEVSLVLTLHLQPDNDGYVVQLPCLPDVPFSIAGDENENVGILVRAIFEQPDKSIGTWITCEPEQISCRQW